jgi:galactokinase
MLIKDERKSLMMQEFAARFGDEPANWALAPGRVDLMGSHTDYNQGYVLTLALDCDTCIAARPRPDRHVAIQSLNLDGSAVFDMDRISHDPQAPWTNYVRGVAAILQSEGYSLGGFDGLVHSTVPLSSGLSSSAALEVATALLFNQMGNLGIDPVRLALLCQRAENQFVGMNCGILDQYTSAVCPRGSALLLDCRHLTSEPVGLQGSVRVVLCDTRARRELTGSEYPERRAQCEQGVAQLAEYDPGVTALRDVSLEQFALLAAALPAIVAKRCRFILEENQRVLDLALALPAGDQDAICKLTAASFAGARNLYEIVTPEMEKMMEAMLGAPGAIGARQAGAGFGGCMVAFVQDSLAGQFTEYVRQAYTAATGILPNIFPA